MPHLIDERQCERDACPDDIHRDQERTPWQAVGIRPDNWRDADIGHHLDGKRRSQYGSGIATRDVISQQPKRDSGKSCADQRNDLRRQQMAIGAVFED